MLSLEKCLLKSFSSVTQLCLTLCDPMETTTRQASLSFTVSRSLLKFLSIEFVILSNHLNFRCPLLLLPSVTPLKHVVSTFIFLHSNSKARIFLSKLKFQKKNSLIFLSYNKCQILWGVTLR